MTRPFSLAIWLGPAVALSLVCCTSDPEKKQPAAAAPPRALSDSANPAPDTARAILSQLAENSLQNGQALYEANCVRCHGLNGISVMEGVPHLAEGGCPQREMRGMILSGRGLMPSFRDQLSGPEIGQVVQYVMALREQHAASR